MNIAGERIKELRLRNNLTQEDVAKHLGIGKQAVYKYETGAVTNIPLENLEKMSVLFHVSPEYLAGWAEQSVINAQLESNERRLLTAFRAADPKYQDLALELLEEHPAEAQKEKTGHQAG